MLNFINNLTNLKKMNLNVKQNYRNTLEPVIKSIRIVILAKLNEVFY